MNKQVSKLANEKYTKSSSLTNRPIPLKLDADFEMVSIHL